MAGIPVTNWFGDLTSHPQVVVEAASVDDIVTVLKDPGQYPSPVRAVGSNHSTSPCGVADGGTLIKMSKMNRDPGDRYRHRHGASRGHLYRCREGT